MAHAVERRCPYAGRVETSDEAQQAVAAARTRDEIMAALEPQVSTKRLVRYGLVLWTVALAVVWLVPDLHTGGRRWWGWVPVAGIVLGLIGLGYLHRGRGNAQDAD